MNEPEFDTPGDSASPADPGPLPFPWPPPEREPVVSAWARTWLGAALQPRHFFAAMPMEGSLGAAVLYYLSIGIPVAGAQLFWDMVRGGDAVATSSSMAIASASWTPLLEFLFSPALLLLSLFFAAGVTHVLLKILGAAGGSYRTTTLVFAYSYSPQILGVIPVAGELAGSIWMVVISIIGLREAHRTTTGRAAAAVLIPLIIALIFIALLTLIMRAGLIELPA